MIKQQAARPVDWAALDDAALVRLARAGDAASFRAIMQRSNRRLYRIARAVVNNDSEAEDVVQEAYVRAFTGLKDFRGESSLATWLSRIVLNEAMGRLRRRRPTVDIAAMETRQAPQGDVVRFPLASMEPDPERAIAQRQISALLESAIDGLPDPFRTVLVARAVEGMSIEETAELFGLKPETVKTRLHRARHLLREALEKQIGPVLSDAFPFDGRRCQRTTEAVLARVAAIASKSSGRPPSS
jgi:RNA polymerase sigma-70 factor (ECF subfamily)